MKRMLLVTFSVALLLSAAFVIGQKKMLSPREERREQREARRAARLAEYEKMMDSLILSHNFQFNPSSMQRQPAGPLRTIVNPEFNVALWGSMADICLPYIKGFTPPYAVTVINCTIPTLDHFTTEQTSEGWLVQFSSSLFTGSTFTFVFEIYSRTGGAVLTVKNPWYADVQYTGTISQLY